MKTLILFIIITVSASLFFGSISHAAQRVGTRPQGICTRDYNAWGHASNCSCSHNRIYDDRSGLCLQGELIKKITVQGAISSGLMAVGGETTGFAINTATDDSYELILKTVDQEKLTKLSGMWFEIEGEMITIESVELKERQAIIADRIAVLE